MQLTFNSGALPVPASTGTQPASLSRMSDLRQGESALIDSIDLPLELACRLMELGFVPGNSVEAAGSAPGGGPRVFRIDGTEIALRRETASRVTIRS